MNKLVSNKNVVIAFIAIVAIGGHLLIRFDCFGLGQSLAATSTIQLAQYPLYLALLLGGVPLVLELLTKAVRREFGSDLLAGISIVTGILLHEYLAATLVVLMLSGGEAIEAFAVRKASAVLDALARRMPARVHRLRDGAIEEVPIDAVEIGDELEVFPHEICPVDGTVLLGHSRVDESYLTGEPYMLSKTPGSEILSGSINGEERLVIRADSRAVDSRYARIMQVMKESEQQRPRIRRLGDTLGAYYTPLALFIALIAWFLSGDPLRFLSVLVVATPCPLLIAIPVTIVGAISLAAQRGILIKDPAVLEQVDLCRTIIFDKTGTLTYGKPNLIAQLVSPPWTQRDLLQLVSSAERYSKHPLATAILEAASVQGIELLSASSISEKPGAGLLAEVAGRMVTITSRKKFIAAQPSAAAQLPPQASGLECIVLVDSLYAATYQFRDEPREDGNTFIKHLGPRHKFSKVMLVSGDRESEVSYLAKKVGITEIHASQSPEQKLEIVRRERALAPTIFIGDGINDAPALSAATVGIALGQHSDITSEAAGAIILDSSLARVDDFFHISQRMRRIALQSAVGGMALSVIGMAIAAFGFLPPVAGAVFQEVIDVFAVLNALRVAYPPATLSDLHR